MLIWTCPNFKCFLFNSRFFLKSEKASQKQFLIMIRTSSCDCNWEEKVHMNFVVMRRVLVHESDYQVVEFFARLFLISEHVFVLARVRSWITRDVLDFVTKRKGFSRVPTTGASHNRLTDPQQINIESCIKNTWKPLSYSPSTVHTTILSLKRAS